ncbi:hypothetical protein LSH36_226g02007 [Paralvinella palmiformis]|uniref:Uncharacterized protein n=1 Tax=Paralvinella palmiformis TaxID=53620 RepID=A0AAD9JMR4_9ANNE|nr:hypothetical protein LSH36_226g02007 [Paralvinella palmiformis]
MLYLNTILSGVVNWLEGLFHFLLFPSRRHRTRCLLLIGLLMFMITVLNRGQHPMTFNHSIHSPTSHNSWYRFFTELFGGGSTDHKPIRRQLVQDWVFAPNCDALLRGDEEEIHFTKRMLYREVRDKVMDNEYYENTRSCAEFRAAEGYSPVPLSPEEANFPIAYLIQSYKNAEQLHRLLKSIYAPQNPYCICSNHKATPDFDRSVRSIANCFHNVYHVSTLHFNRTKGHKLTEIDDIKCARKCIKVLLNADWKYLIKIHGQDYPLVTTQYIVAKLRNLERLRIPFISDYSHMHRKQSVKVITSEDTSNRSDTIDLTLWTGSPYFIASNGITRRVMDNILTYKLLPLIEHHEHPEAYYWVTLFLYTMKDADHAAIVAANRHRIELLTQKNLHTKQYCAGITQLLDTCVLGVEDLSKLFHAHHHQFFAHGFDLDHDHIAYSCLEQRILDAILDYGGNLTETFNDERLHAQHPEIELTFKDKSFNKTQNKHTNTEMMTIQEKPKDVKKTINEMETEEAMKRKHLKQSLDDQQTKGNDDEDDKKPTEMKEDKKSIKYAKDRDYYDIKTNISNEADEQLESKRLEKKVLPSDQSSGEKNDRSNREVIKDDSGVRMATNVLFPVTEGDDLNQQKQLMDILKSGSHVNKHRHEPEKLELDMLELDHGAPLYYQVGIKGKSHIQDVDEGKKEVYERPDVQTVYSEGHDVRSTDTVIQLDNKHDVRTDVLNADINIKEKKSVKDDMAIPSEGDNMLINKDMKADIR